MLLSVRLPASARTVTVPPAPAVSAASTAAPPLAVIAVFSVTLLSIAPATTLPPCACSSTSPPAPAVSVPPAALAWPVVTIVASGAVVRIPPETSRTVPPTRVAAAAPVVGVVVMPLFTVRNAAEPAPAFATTWTSPPLVTIDCVALVGTAPIDRAGQRPVCRDAVQHQRVRVRVRVGVAQVRAEIAQLRARASRLRYRRC